MNQLIFESNVLFSILDEEDPITKPEEIPEHFIEQIDSLINQINLDLLLSFQEGKRDFSEEEYVTMIRDMNFIDNINLKKAIIYFKYIYEEDGIGIHDLDKFIKKLELEDNIFLTLCRYDYSEDLIYFEGNDEKLGLMVSILYNSEKCIEYFEKRNVEKFEQLNNQTIRSAVKLYFKNKDECLILYGPMQYWNTSGVTDMSELFIHINKEIPDISRWNTCNVTDMSGMFVYARKFNSDISNWNVSNVMNMSQMFFHAKNFNSDISRWNTSNVRNMSGMFFTAESFNCDISKWNVSNVTDMSSMFSNNNFFNSDISKWDVGNVTNMKWMFSSVVSFNSDISNWNVSNVRDMSDMFNGAKSFNQNISKWNVSNVTNMLRMFYGAENFNSDISRWNTSNVRNMSKMFSFATTFNQNISKWNVRNVTDSSNIFSGCNINEEYKPIFN